MKKLAEYMAQDDLEGMLAQQQSFDDRNKLKQIKDELDNQNKKIYSQSQQLSANDDQTADQTSVNTA